MAEFSKQWISINEGTDSGWDFDIDEIASTIKNEHYTPVVCEGFGFVVIGKTETGDVILGYRNHETDEIEWKSFNDVINEEISRHGN